MELKKYKLGELGKVITGKTPKTSKKENFDNGVIPFYTPEDIARGIGITGKNERFITEIGLSEIKNNSLEDESVLVGCIGSDMGNVAYTNHRCAMNQQINAITSFKDYICPLYVYYYLSTKKQEFRKIAGATTTPILPKSVFCDYIILLPKYHIQRKIASVLYNIDRKIEINRAINQNLEAMAKQLYDYWFVQFDFPNENGRPYKSSGGKMVWNEKLKREIPEGWDMSLIKDIAITYSGGTPKSTNVEYYDNGEIAWINSGELNSPIITTTTNYITKCGLENSSAKLYPSNSILVAMYGATAGKVSLLTFEACSNQAVCGVIPKVENMLYYVYFHISSLYSHFITLSTGSARDNISQNTIKNILLPIPTRNILKLFDEKIGSIYQMIVNNYQQIDSLTMQRDELLPLLMNGQVSVNSDLSDD